MVRAWLRAVFCVCLGALAGCGGDNRDSIINDTNNQVAAVATSVGNIKNKVEDFVAKKEAAGGKDDEATNALILEAVNEAKALKETAKKMQTLSSRASSQTPPTDEERKAFLEKHKKRVNETQADLKEAHRAMKVVVADANSKYEEAMRPLMKALSDAEGEFAAITRRK